MLARVATRRIGYDRRVAYNPVGRSSWNALVRGVAVMFGSFFGGKKPVTAATAFASKRKRVQIEKRFSIIAETGSGSMSHVYKAYDNENGRTICLKVQDPQKSAAAVSRAS